jgi:hypothetical protein
MAAVLLGGIFEECPNARQLARGRSGAESLRPPLGKESAQIGSLEIE